MNGLRGLDKIFSVLLIILGSAQAFATPLFFQQIEEPAAWFAAGGLALAFVGAVSLLRIHYDQATILLWRVSVMASTVAALFWLSLACFLQYKFLRYPAAFAALAVVCLHAAIAIMRTARRTAA